MTEPLLFFIFGCALGVLAYVLNKREQRGRK